MRAPKVLRIIRIEKIFFAGNKFTAKKCYVVWVKQ
jgi:hypothetical protein